MLALATFVMVTLMFIPFVVKNGKAGLDFVKGKLSDVKSKI